MINTDMKTYLVYAFGAVDAYGQEQLNELPSGSVKMSINILNQAIADNINYKNATYIGLTMDKTLNEGYIIQYEENKRLKVLYVNPKGRYAQVYLGDYDNGPGPVVLNSGVI
jgi:hypothetical protein